MVTSASVLPSNGSTLLVQQEYQSVLGMTIAGIAVASERAPGQTITEFVNALPENTLVYLEGNIPVSAPITPRDGVVLIGRARLIADQGVDVIRSARSLGLVDIEIAGGSIGITNLGGRINYQNVVVVGAASHGLDMRNGSIAVGTGFVAWSCGGDGIRFRGNAGGRFIDTTIAKCGANGVSDSSDGAKAFEGIVTRDNKGHGFVLLEGSFGTAVYNVKANGNSGSGIAVGRAGSARDSAASGWQFVDVEAIENKQVGFTVDVVRAAHDRLYTLGGTAENLQLNRNGINGLNVNYCKNVRFRNVTTNDNAKNGSIVISGHDVVVDGLTSQNNGVWGLSLVDSPHSPDPIPYGDGVRIINGVYENNRHGNVKISKNYTNTVV